MFRGSKAFEAEFLNLFGSPNCHYQIYEAGVPGTK